MHRKPQSSSKIFRGKWGFWIIQEYTGSDSCHETMGVWYKGTQQRHYVFLLMTFLTPAKLSWSSATYPEEAGDAACRTSAAGLHGQAPLRNRRKLTPKQGQVSVPHDRVLSHVKCRQARDHHFLHPQFWFPAYTCTFYNIPQIQLNQYSHERNRQRRLMEIGTTTKSVRSPLFN